MAKIAFESDPLYRAFAQEAQKSGLHVEELDGGAFTIEDSPKLEIPFSMFEKAVARQPSVFKNVAFYKRVSMIEVAWRNLVVNREGYLTHLDLEKFIITDKAPGKSSNFLVRFPTEGMKREAEEWARLTGHTTLTDYILKALTSYNNMWMERTKPLMGGLAGFRLVRTKKTDEE